MATKVYALTILLFLLTACAPATPGGASPQPPSQTHDQAPTATSTAAALPTPQPLPSPSASAGPACADSALFLADVTIDDSTKLKAGQSFTKTWQLRNTGNCAWDSGYTLVFAGGDRMRSPDSVPLPETASNATLNLSIDLIAPASDGIFTSVYEIHNPQGKAIPIGLTQNLWVKIIVGNVVFAQATEITAGAPTSRPKSPCQPERSTTEIVTLINNAREAAGLPRLNVNAQLTASAQGHSDDMACHNLVSHTGSNGSSAQERIIAAGYSPSNWGEIIYAGGSAQQAFDGWMNDPPHRAILLDPIMDDVGAGYTYVAGSEYGGYFTVDFGRP